jgi:hypothetical protein
VIVEKKAEKARNLLFFLSSLRIFKVLLESPLSDSVVNSKG